MVATVSNQPTFPSAVHWMSRTLEADPLPSLASGEVVSRWYACPPPCGTAPAARQPPFSLFLAPYRLSSYWFPGRSQGGKTVTATEAKLFSLRAELCRIGEGPDGGQMNLLLWPISVPLFWCLSLSVGVLQLLKWVLVSHKGIWIPTSFLNWCFCRGLPIPPACWPL